MKTLTSLYLSLATLLAPQAPQTDGVRQQDAQEAIVRQLASNDAAQQRRALDAVEALGQRELGDSAKAALATALQQESRRHARRYWQRRSNQALEPLPDPELIGALARTVAPLGDPRAIPAMAESMGFGFPITRALAAFGLQAAPAVLDVVMSPQSPEYAVNDGLIALRLMVEASTTSGPLTTPTMARITAAAEHHLTTKPRFIPTVWWAIDLAAALGEPRLRAIVQEFASDPALATAMGATDPGLVEQTRKRAADRLAGIAPLPRP
jgi:hypothetical protein